MRYKVVYERNARMCEIKFNGTDEKEKAEIFLLEFVRAGFKKVRIVKY